MPSISHDLANRPWRAVVEGVAAFLVLASLAGALAAAAAARPAAPPDLAQATFRPIWTHSAHITRASKPRITRDHTG